MKTDKTVDAVETAIEDIAGELSDKVTKSRFSKNEIFGKPIQVGVIAGVAGGITGALSMYVRDDVHPAAAIAGAVTGCAVGYAVGKLVYPAEVFCGGAGKILAGAAGFFNGVGIAAGTAELVNSFISPVVVADDL